jgi:hypothetical protein
VNIIKLEISTELLESWIIRRMAVVYGEGVDIAPARGLAEELITVLTGYLNLQTVRPPWRLLKDFSSEEPAPAEEKAKIEAITVPDLLFAVLRTALGWWPEDSNATADESCWILEQFDAVDGDELYERYLRLSDKINHTKIADPFGDDNDGGEPALID